MPGPLTSTSPSATTVPTPTSTSTALTPKTARQLSHVRGFGSVAFRSLNRLGVRWTPYPFKFSMAPSNGTTTSKTASATSTAPKASKPVGFLQLPTLDTFAPLTEGTDLPSVTLDPSPPPSSASNKPSALSQPPAAADEATTTTNSPPLSPLPTSPTSPNRPGSVRRFLSRVSMNSAYEHGKEEEHTKPPMSPTASMHSGGIARSASKKGSWWRRGKAEKSEGTPLRQEKVRAITPPPTLPEVKGSQAEFEEDIFKGFH